MTPVRAVPEWTARTRVQAAVLVLALAVMVLVPASRAGSDGQTRFAWRMFDTVQQFPDFVVVTSDGDELPVELDDHVAFSRADLPLVEALPPHLCQNIPNAGSVLIAHHDSTRTVSC